MTGKQPLNDSEILEAATEVPRPNIERLLARVPAVLARLQGNRPSPDPVLVTIATARRLLPRLGLATVAALLLAWFAAYRRGGTSPVTNSTAQADTQSAGVRGGDPLLDALSPSLAASLSSNVDQTADSTEGHQ